MQQYLEAALLAVFIGISAFFAAMEVAFLSISAVKMHTLLEKKAPGAEALSRLREKRRKVVIALLIGNNIANVAASAFATSLALGIFGDAGLGVAVGVMSFLLLTFGDIAPKSAATSYGEKIALTFSGIVEIYFLAAYPLVVFFDFINHLIPGVYSRATGIEMFTEQEVRSAVKLGAKHKGISEREKELIENVLEFNDKTVEAAMTPRGGVESMPSDISVAESYRRALKSGYSRFPVIGRDGKVVGVTGMKTLARNMAEQPHAKVHDVATEPVRLKISEKASNAFYMLQKLGRNIAIVENENGGFAGVVTLEDLLEELVGEIK